MSGGSSNSRTEDGLQFMLNNMSQQQLMQLFGGVAAGGQMGLSSLLGSINRSSGNRNSSSTVPSSGTSTRATSGSTVAATPTNASLPAAPRAPRKANNSSGATQPAGTTPATGGSDTSRVLLSELQNYLAGINTGLFLKFLFISVIQLNYFPGSGSKQNVDLSTSFNVEAINSILSDSDRLTNLRDHLPNTSAVGDDSKDDVKEQLKNTVLSPQFQQALSRFSSALQSGQLGPVVSQFKLNEQAIEAANNGDLEQFIKALENSTVKTEASTDDKTDGENKEPKN